MLRMLFVVILISGTFAEPVQEAIAKIEGEVHGIVNFFQHDQEVCVIGDLRGLKPGKHGFHIHVSGDLSQGCGSAGSHFNPFNRNHGDITSYDRHVGDLGNIDADENGVAIFNIRDTLISLNGITSIIGRAVVVHADVDDLGYGGQEDSLVTGHAGARAGCGVIGIVA